MKSILIKVLVPLLLFGMVAVDYASARGGGRGGGRSGGAHFSGGHHGSHHHGFRSGTRFGFFAGGAFVPWYYYYGPPYYAPSPYSMGYVEQDGFWYYCPTLQTYYPYVMQCPGEWQRVDPQPPPPSEIQAPVP